METMLENNVANAAAISASTLSVSFGEHIVLNKISLNIARGEIYAVLGGNGAGKSTLMNTLLGFLKPVSGRAMILGFDTYREAQQARQQFAYVPENVALYENLSACENISYLLALAQIPQHDQSTVEAALTQVGLPREAWHRRLGSYSKGMRQKVAIALAIARHTPVLLLDEPTSGLDPRATIEFNQLLRRLGDDGITSLMVTHDLLGAADVADRIGFLHNGCIEEEMSAAGNDRFDVQQLYRRYAHAGAAA